MLYISICGYTELFDPSIVAHTELERIFADPTDNKKLICSKYFNDYHMVECYINERDPMCPIMMLRTVLGQDITLEVLNSEQAFNFAVKNDLDKGLIANLSMFYQQSKDMDGSVEYGKNIEVM